MLLYMKPQPMKHETPFRTSHIQPHTTQHASTTSFSHSVFQVVIFRAFRDDITKAAADSFRFAPLCRRGLYMHCECGLLLNRRLPLAIFLLNLRSAPLSSLFSNRALPPAGCKCLPPKSSAPPSSNTTTRPSSSCAIPTCERTAFSAAILFTCFVLVLRA